MASSKRGARGQTVARGETGARGRTGARGKTGTRGRIGKTGPPGPSMQREDVLAIVEDPFREIRKQLDLHLQRTAQIQAQLDHLAGLIKNVINQP